MGTTSLFSMYISDRVSTKKLRTISGVPPIHPSIRPSIHPWWCVCSWVLVHYGQPQQFYHNLSSCLRTPSGWMHFCMFSFLVWKQNGQWLKRKNHGMQKCIHPLCLAMLSKVFTKVGWLLVAIILKYIIWKKINACI